MSKTSQSAYVQKPTPAEIRAMFVWSLQQILYAVPMRFNTTFSSSSHRGAHSRRKFLVSLEYTDIHSLLVAVTLRSHWSCHIMHEPNVWLLMKRQMFQEYGRSVTKIRSYAAPVNLLGKTTAPKIWSSKNLTQTSMENNDDVLMPRWCGYCHPPRHAYYESSQYRPLWIPPQQ
jgi:hypothetical protein